MSDIRKAMDYKHFCYALAEAIVKSRELNDEEYEEWKRIVPELSGEHGTLAKKVMGIVDSCRNSKRIVAL